MDGLDINVDEKQFKEMTQPDQMWMIFKKIESIDKYGCSWGKLHESSRFYDFVKIVGIGVGAGAASGIGIWKLICG